MKWTWTTIPALLAAFAGSASAQWDTLAGIPANPVRIEGFHALHDDGVNLQAYSAMAQTWTPIGATGSAIVGSGDWTTLFDEPGPGGFTAYSARLNETSPAPIAPGPFLELHVEDDVILIVKDLGGSFQAAAYSAQTNTWDVITVDDVPIVATSRFVAAMYVPGDLKVYGFGARVALWSSVGISLCQPPVADGNCVAMVHTDAINVHTILAFSGITNTFAFSSPAPTDFHLIDHDVVYANVSQPGGYQHSGFSAYTGQWVTSPNFYIDGQILSITTRDKLLLAEMTAPTRFEAIGALPQGGWAPLVGSSLTLLGLSEDSAIVEDTQANPALLYGISGLCGGGWVTEPGTAPFTYVDTPEHANLVADPTDTFHGFSPLKGMWSTTNLAGAIPQAGDCVAVVATAGGDAMAWCARWNAWIPAPAPNPALAYALNATGSVLARTSGPAGVSTSIEFFDERSNAWLAPSPLFAGVPVALNGNRNVMFVVDGMGHLGFSALRGDLVASPGGGLTTTALVEEDVLVQRVAGGTIHAFGSASAAHSMYDYPLDTETHAFTRLGGVPMTVRYAIHAPSGVSTLYAVASVPFFPGIPVAFGTLFLLPPFLTVILGGAAGPGDVASGDIVLPAGGVCLQVWSQAARLGPVQLLGAEPEPVLIFP